MSIRWLLESSRTSTSFGVIGLAEINIQVDHLFATIPSTKCFRYRGFGYHFELSTYPYPLRVGTPPRTAVYGQCCKVYLLPNLKDRTIWLRAEVTSTRLSHTPVRAKQKQVKERIY